ncbi:MAG: TrkH family potassium uptake protein [Rhodobacteraceae bacterium]|nr:MAG: TrkH family potassium uptake protein [Paracoccaceae bacterium]
MVVLIALTGGAMLLPAAVGFTLREHALARAFLYSALLLISLAMLIALAIRGMASRNQKFSHPFYYLAAAYLVLPLLMAIPMVEAIPGLGFFNAWFEMLSAFTTTGASVMQDAGTRPINLWRATVAWGGGMFFLVAVTALLAPLRLGGFELFGMHSRVTQVARGPAGRHLRSPLEGGYSDRSLSRMRSASAVIAPVYLAATLVLWVGLSLAGNPPVIALILAMATISTSGIAPSGALGGFVAEVLIALVLLMALSRRLWPGAQIIRQEDPRLWCDTELRIAAAILVVLTLLLGLRAMYAPLDAAFAPRLAELWGIVFTSLSFLTTAGFVSEVGRSAEGVFSGAAGTVLLALALCGGGVATTAGGVKLMRVFALFWQARREVEKLVHPDSVGGDGPRLRLLRQEGAFSAWLFLMVFILSMTGLTALLTLTGVAMEDAMIYITAALTTTGPVAQMTGPVPLDWADLSRLGLAISALGMVLGRLELLLLLSVLWSRGSWAD